MEGIFFNCGCADKIISIHQIKTVVKTPHANSALKFNGLLVLFSSNSQGLLYCIFINLSCTKGGGGGVWDDLPQRFCNHTSA